MGTVVMAYYTESLQQDFGGRGNNDPSKEDQGQEQIDDGGHTKVGTYCGGGI